MIVKPGRSISVQDFDALLDIDGNEVTTGFTKVDPSPISGEITSQNSITLGEAGDDPILPGEMIVISGIDDARTSRLVDSVSGLKLILHEQFELYEFPVAVTVQRKKYLLKTTTELKEGRYRLSPDNALLVVRNSFNNPWIDTDDLEPFDADSAQLSDGEMIRLNNAALQKVYKDLDTFDNIYDAVWFDSIKVLKIYAMAAIRAASTTVENAAAKRAVYREELKSVEVRYKITEDKALNGGAPVDEVVAPVRRRWSW